MDNNLFKCTRCGLDKNQSSFPKNQTKVCKECKKKTCPICGIKVNSLKLHTDIMHKNYKPVKCEYCEYRCHEMCALKTHICYRGAKEEDVQKRLQQELAAGSVSTPAGQIDILTGDQIIEIKHWNQWKQGLGQILIYSNYYPNHKRRVHFYGVEPKNKVRVLINEFYLKYDISITHEENIVIIPEKVHPQCSYVVQQGPTKGTRCSKLCRKGDVCHEHKDIRVRKQCNYIFKQGKNSGNQCETTCREGEFCSEHTIKTSTPYI